MDKNKTNKLVFGLNAEMSHCKLEISRISTELKCSITILKDAQKVGVKINAEIVC